VNPDGYLRAITADGQAVLDAGSLGLDPPVPSTPGWTVREVIAHLGQVHRQKTDIVRHLLVDMAPEPPHPPADNDLLEWFAEGLHELTAVLSEADPASRVYTWHEPDQSVNFWIRRMAHETLIHRVDVELGHGTHSAVDPVLAADGVDEVLDVFMSGYPPWAEVTRSRVIVRLMSEGRTWRLRFLSWSGTSPNSGRTFEDEPGIEFDDGSHKPDAVIRGSSDALDLFLWGRGSADGLTVDGHPSVLLYLRDLAAASTK
jgi:uncharacterized protein (TIGR03083 family)